MLKAREEGNFVVPLPFEENIVGNAEDNSGEHVGGNVEMQSREEAATILDAASNPGGPPWRSSTQSIATDDQALALHSDVNFSGAPLKSVAFLIN
ncbi:hypothetical protein SUGI_0212750 [Cryptomeria japonica]|nr:hypothetical protein SUGI_0212750 [Cryptomeria japonica]